MYVPESISVVLSRVRLRLTKEIFPSSVEKSSGIVGLLRVTRVLLNGTPFLIQVISGGGIPVAEQVKVTGSVSFTVYVKLVSRGKVMLGMTGGEQMVRI